MQGRFNTEDDVPFTDLYTPALYMSVNRTATDFTDNITKICSTNSMQSATAGRCHKRIFTPSTPDQAYESMTSTGYNPEFNQWLTTDDTAAPGPHFGMDVLLSSTPSPKGSFKYKMRTSIICQWKNKKPSEHRPSCLLSTSIGQETAKRQSPRQPVRQISVPQADDTQLESCSWVAVPARVHPHLTRPLDAVVHPPQWRLISTARPLPELGSGTKNTHGIIRMHETENHQRQNRY